MTRLSALLLCTALANAALPLSEAAAIRTHMLVTTEWLSSHLGDHNLVVLFIGHDRRQFDAGHIPGARFVRLDELVEQHLNSPNELPPVAELQALFESVGASSESRIVLYGEGGGVLAARAYFTLDTLGLGERTALLDGGMEKWKAEGRALSLQETHPAPGHIALRPHFDIAVTATKMEDASDRASQAQGSAFALLDARPPAEFEGVVASEGVSKAGHIPGAASLYWKTLLRSEAQPELLPVDELQRAFREAGVRPEQTVVTYCRTGMQSSFTYFVAKYLGYHAAMYDGSVYEWVQAKGKDLVKSPAAGAATVRRSTR